MTGKAHPQMKQVMLPFLEVFKKEYPVFFNGLNGEGE